MMWRVAFRLANADTDHQVYDEERAARDFLAGIVTADSHQLLQEARLEEWDGDGWRERE